jgi:hypothetical protein
LVKNLGNLLRAAQELKDTQVRSLFVLNT